MTQHATSSTRFMEDIRKAVDSRYPMVYVVGAEEDRIAGFLANAAEEHYGDKDHFHTWTASRGFDDEDLDNEALKNPQAALEYLLAEADDGFYLLKDLPDLFDNNPGLVRALRDYYYRIGERNIMLFFSHPVSHIPEQLKKEMYVTEMGLPTEREVYNYLAAEINAANGQIRVDSRWLRRFTQSVKGLSMAKSATCLTGSRPGAISTCSRP